MEVPHLTKYIDDRYECYEWRHASAVMKEDFASEWRDLIHVLENYQLKQHYITQGGGNKSLTARRIDGLFRDLGWQERRFNVEITVDKDVHPSPTHAVDNFKNRIAQETEWNNKDAFFDRDLNNFRLLHQIDVASVGIIITRSDDLAELWERFDKTYTESTTHMSKLRPKIEGGGAGGCPILVIGITKKLFVPEEA